MKIESITLKNTTIEGYICLTEAFFVSKIRTAFTLFEIFIFVQKINFDFSRKLSIFWVEKFVKMCGVLDFLAVDSFDFTRKIVKKNLGEKLVKMLGFCQQN